MMQYSCPRPEPVSAPRRGCLTLRLNDVCGWQVALPPNWEELEDEDGNVYFYDKATGKSSIKHPMDDYFFALVQEERRKAAKRKARNEVPDAETNLRQLWMPFVDETTGASYFYNFRKVRRASPCPHSRPRTAAPLAAGAREGHIMEHATPASTALRDALAGLRVAAGMESALPRRMARSVRWHGQGRWPSSPPGRVCPEFGSTRFSWSLSDVMEWGSSQQGPAW